MVDIPKGGTRQVRIKLSEDPKCTAEVEFVNTDNLAISPPSVSLSSANWDTGVLVNATAGDEEGNEVVTARVACTCHPDWNVKESTIPFFIIPNTCVISIYVHPCNGNKYFVFDFTGAEKFWNGSALTISSFTVRFGGGLVTPSGTTRYIYDHPNCNYVEQVGNPQGKRWASSAGTLTEFTAVSSVDGSIINLSDVYFSNTNEYSVFLDSSVYDEPYYRGCWATGPNGLCYDTEDVASGILLTKYIQAGGNTKAPSCVAGGTYGPGTVSVSRTLRSFIPYSIGQYLEEPIPFSVTVTGAYGNVTCSGVLTPQKCGNALLSCVFSGNVTYDHPCGGCTPVSESITVPVFVPLPCSTTTDLRFALTMTFNGGVGYGPPGAPGLLGYVARCWTGTQFKEYDYAGGRVSANLAIRTWNTAW